MSVFRIRAAVAAASLFASLVGSPALTGATASGIGNVPQGTQSDAAYARSYQQKGVTNVFATTQRVSCYRPEVPYGLNEGPAEGYSGETSCTASMATTGEDIGLTAYQTQSGSNAGYPAGTPMLVKDHSESDLRVDPINSLHLIGSSKWFASPEGYNHLLGFYESFDGGKTWPTQGHVPGYEGWTDNTDPVGAFDGFGNYYEFVLGYQFYYNADGSHNFNIGSPQEPNPNLAAEVVAVAVHPHGSTQATGWITTRNGRPDYVATYDSIGNEPDKQWIAIDSNPASPNYNTIYAMWTVFHTFASVPYVATSKALPDGTHTDWSLPQVLPTTTNSAGDTYLLPHVDPSGVIWTSVTNFPGKGAFCCASIGVDFSSDGGKTWQGTLPAVPAFTIAPFCCYQNTNTRSGITNSFAVGPSSSPRTPARLYIAWEDYSTGFANTLISASDDGGHTWTAPIQVNDNANANTDEFQPNLAVASTGTVSVAFYDRRLACPAASTGEASAAGLALDTNNPNYSGSLPPYGASNYCVNASVQFYSPTLQPRGHNIRLTAHTWDPELNAALYSNGNNVRKGFIGDYFGNITAGSINYSSFVSTYDDGSNPAHRQQQVIATVTVP